MGAAASSPIAPAQSTPEKTSPSELLTSTTKSVDHEVERSPYPSPESIHNIEFDKAFGDNGTEIKDESMSDILPSIEEADLIERELDNSYDANERYADLDVEERHEQDAQLKAAEQSGQGEFDLASFVKEQSHRGLKMVQDGWNPDTVNAYMLIERRDYEILFPDSWRCQFPLFPAEIFCNRYSPNNGLLGPLTEARDTTMKWALTKFIELGPRVRDNSRPGGHTWYKRRPEGLVEDHIKRYAKMVYKDAGLVRDVQKKYLPKLYAFASGMYGTPLKILEAKILRKLRRRSSRLLDLLRVNDDTPVELVDAAENCRSLFKHNGVYYLYEPPTLFGVISSETVSALVAYEPLAKAECLRQIAFFHFSKDVFDVWNCVALAIMVVWCRDHMLNMKDILPDHPEEMEVDIDDADL